MRAPTGRSRLAAVIGDPIRHSRSPDIFNAAFEAAGIDWVYVAFEVAAGDVAGALEGMRTFGIEGLSVTMPHKTDAADYLDGRPGDELSEGARRLRAVNCVARSDDGLIGHNTDGAGLVASLRIDADFDPHGQRCAVVGAGGAARAIVWALTGAGAAEVAVVNRTRAAAESAARLAGAVGRVADPADLTAMDLVVNATSVGMDGTSLAVDPELLRPDQLVVDIITQPAETPLLVAAGERGARRLGGLGMLVHQAAVAFELWTGESASLDAMTRAASAPASGSGGGGPY
jgi:shikimate dehydrogenase